MRAPKALTRLRSSPGMRRSSDDVAAEQPTSRTPSPPTDRTGITSRGTGSAALKAVLSAVRRSRRRTKSAAPAPLETTELRRIVATSAALARFNAYEQYELIEALEVLRIDSGSRLDCRDFGIFFIVVTGAVALRVPTPVQFAPRHDGSVVDIATGGVSASDIVDWSEDAPPSTSSADWTEIAIAGTTWADAQLSDDGDALGQDAASPVSPGSALRRRSSALTSTGEACSGEGVFILFTVPFHANPAHSLTCSFPFTSLNNDSTRGSRCGRDR